MRFPNKETVERVRKAYPVGCRVELVQMDDEQAPPLEQRVRSEVWMTQPPSWSDGIQAPA